jgi:hypothetical protein
MSDVSAGVGESPPIPGVPMKKQKKTFDAVAFMRKRREELSRAYAGLTAEQIEERI